MTGLLSPSGSEPTYRVRPCGDSGLIIDLENNEHVHALAHSVRDAEIYGVLDVVPAMYTVFILIDPRVTSIDAVITRLRSMRISGIQPEDCQEVIIPVAYDGDDLEFVAQYTSLSVDEIIHAHSQSRWRVAFCGFAPGFAYLTGGDPRLYVPRRGESRVRVPAGSVGLAGSFSAVYPRQSPGGWQLIGHTDACMWNVDDTVPALLTPGMTVRFQNMDTK